MGSNKRRLSEPGPTTIEYAVLTLGRYYSDEDPIEYKGDATTPRDLTELLNPNRAADSIRISYWASGGKGARWVKHGTLGAMIKDRQALYQALPKKRTRQGKS